MFRNGFFLLEYRPLEYESLLLWRVAFFVIFLGIFWGGDLGFVQTPVILRVADLEVSRFEIEPVFRRDEGSGESQDCTGYRGMFFETVLA